MARKTEQNLQNPWSTAELHLREEDYQWLKAWFESLTQASWEELTSTWRSNIAPEKNYPNSIVTGFLLICLYAEHARRFGIESNLWGTLRRLSCEDAVRETLYSWATEQPTARHRELIQRAAIRLGLRNMFGLEDHQAWYCTIFIQVGFTQKGMERRLAEWLTGQTLPIAVHYLLHGPERHSPTFQTLWERLQQFRHQSLREERLRDYLRDCEWILPSWIDGLIDQAKRAAARSEESSYYAPEPAESPPFLSRPVLQWEHGASPTFNLTLKHLDEYDLVQESYDVVIGDRVFTQLLRQDDGSYVPAGDWDLVVPPLPPRTIATIRSNDSGAILASQELGLWHPEELLTLYNQNGNSVDPYGKKALRGSAVVVTPSFVDITPTPERMWTTPGGQFKFCAIAERDCHNLSLAVEGEELWAFSDVGAAHVVDPTEVVSSCRLLCDNDELTFRSGDPAPTACLAFTLSPDATLRWIRVGLRPVLLENNSQTELFDLTPEDLARPIVVTFGMRYQGRPLRVQHKVPVPFHGALRITPEKITVLHPHKILSTGNAESFPIRVSLRDNPGGDDHSAYVLEGDRLVGRLKDRARPYPNLNGYGASLRVCKGPYNVAKESLQVSEQVLDGGFVGSVIISKDHVRLVPSHNVEPSDSHEVLLWTFDHQVIPVKMQAVYDDEKGLSWVCDNDHERFGSILAVAVFFNGKRLGSWFSLPCWSKNLTLKMDEEVAQRCAEVLRWFKAPILSLYHRRAVHTFLTHQAGVAIPAWLSESAPQTLPLKALPLDDGWTSTLIELLRDFRLHPQHALQQCSSIIEALDPDIDLANPAPHLAGIAHKLCHCGPWITYQILSCWLRCCEDDFNLPDKAQEARKAILDEIKPTKEELQYLVKEVLGLDEYFLKNLIQRACQPEMDQTPTDRHNIALLLQHDGYRRVVTAALFQIQQTRVQRAR